MATDRILVVAESFAGKALPVSLELLTRARQLAGTVEAVTWGDGAETVAPQLGAFGATKVYSVGDLGRALPGVPVAAAIAALVEQDGPPDAILIPTTYDGRDIAGRLSVRLDRSVLTNVVGLTSQDGTLVSEHAIF
ncbi:MAG: electron transfer flavoprotein alpha subunit, partial [Acidimicrobiaceae bacterium]|nr:electron transfer flavoprotein alpha subunit [Acidimicrobiaceae bacterium]